MRTPIALVALISVLGLGCSSSSFTSGHISSQSLDISVSSPRPGNLSSQNPSVSEFSHLMIGGPFGFDYKSGPAYSLKISASPSTLDQILVEQQGNTLNIHFKDNTSITETPRLTISSPTLSEAWISGAAHGRLLGVKTAEFALNVSGASSVEVDGNYRDLSAMLSGASVAKFGNLNLDTFKVEVSGSSRLVADGSASTLKLQESGASSINLGQLSISQAEVECSGASNTSLNVSRSVTGIASGASTIEVKGQATCNVEATGSSRLVQR